MMRDHVIDGHARALRSNPSRFGLGIPGFPHWTRLPGGLDGRRLCADGELGMSWMMRDVVGMVLRRAGSRGSWAMVHASSERMSEEVAASTSKNLELNATCDDQGHL